MAFLQVRDQTNILKTTLLVYHQYSTNSYSYSDRESSKPSIVLLLSFIELNEDMTEHMNMGISDILGQQMGDEFDEDELDAELEDLEAEVMEEEMMKQSEPAASHSSEEPFSLPAVPDDPLNMNTEDEDADALAQLEAEMAWKYDKKRWKRRSKSVLRHASNQQQARGHTMHNR